MRIALRWLFLFLNYMMVTSIPQAWIQNIVSSLAQHWLMVTHSPSQTLQCSPTLAQPYTMMMPTPRPDCTIWWHTYPGPTTHYGDAHTQAGVTHQTCLVLWTWRKLANETNAKNAPKICWKIVLTWGIQTALAIHITQSQDYPYAKNEYKLIVVIYRTRMTILMWEMNADI